MEFHINVEKKYFFGILGALVVLTSLFAVYAYGTNNPEVFGHSVGELGIKLDCAYATRTINNEPLVKMLAGNPEAILAIGTASELGPENGGEWWGLGCTQGYQKTGCDIMLLSNRTTRDPPDVYSGGPDDQGQVCLTDNEEFMDSARISISCCKIGAAN